MSEEVGEQEADHPIFFDIAMDKLRKRFPIDDMNFFDPNTDFNIDVSTIVLCEQIAKGSYGIVYNGVMRREKYAIKVEDLRTGVEEQVNILSELTILQSFPHDGLVKFFGTGYLSKSLSEAKVMIIMELCENGALREKIQEELPWNLVVRLALDVTSGLTFLHENQIVHRDIKTTNILVDKDWRAKICDFSFSCHVNSLIKQEFVYGTDEFMSPEIAMGEDFGLPSDMFSFGIVLCEMITKQEPSAYFLKRTAQNNCFALPEEELRSAVLVDCPESLEALTIECCNTEPDQRPTAQNSFDWLQSLLEELGDDLTSTIATLSSEKSALVGVSPIREGTVIYPKTKELRVARFNSSHTSNIHPPKSPGMNVSEVGSRITYLEVQVQELRAENSCLSREVANVNKKLEELTKLIEPPTTLTRLNSSGRFSTNGSATNTPRYQEPPEQTLPNRSFSNPSIFPTPETAHSPEKDRQLKKIFSEIEYLKFRFSKMSSEISSLKSRELTPNCAVNNDSEEKPFSRGESSSQWDLSPTSSTKLSLQREFNDLLHAEDKRETNRLPNNQNQQWMLTKKGDSPLVRMGSGDQTKPLKRQSPTSYGVSPNSNETTNTKYGFFSSKPSLEVIEVEEHSTDEEEELNEHSSDQEQEGNDAQINAVVQSFLDVVGKCSEITQQSQTTLKTLADRSSSFREGELISEADDDDIGDGGDGDGDGDGDRDVERYRDGDHDYDIHKGTRASTNSQFHYSPHPGFLSQLRLPLNRELRQLERSIRHRKDPRSQSPISTGYSLNSSKPSLLSQPFQRSGGQNQSFSVPHGVSSISPNLTNKRGHNNVYPPEEREGAETQAQEEEEEEEEEEHEYDQTQTPPNASMTWRTVQSRTPPPPSNHSFHLSRYSEENQENIKHSGKMVREDIISIDIPNSSSSHDSVSYQNQQHHHHQHHHQQHQSFNRLNRRRHESEKQSTPMKTATPTGTSPQQSTRPLRNGSKSTPSPTLREKLEADRQRTEAAKNFFQADLVHDSIFRKDGHRAVQNLHSSSLQNEQMKKTPKPLRNLVGSKL